MWQYLAVGMRLNFGYYNLQLAKYELIKVPLDKMIYAKFTSTSFNMIVIAR